MSPLSARPPGRSANIFINYRREDSSGHAGRLFDGLNSHFSGRLFMDVDTIAPGVDFVEAIEKAVGSCEVLIVVIGQDWLSLKNAAGQRRLDDPGDFVRLEVETALARNIRVIPVLVQDAPPPRAEDLPPSLARLARRNAIELSDVRWAYDVNRLAQTIQGILGEEASLPAPADPPRRDVPPPSPAGRSAGPRVWLFLLAALVLVSASVLASAAWLSRRESLPPPSQPVNLGLEGLAKVTDKAAIAEPRDRIATHPSEAANPEPDPEPVKKLVRERAVADRTEDRTATNRAGSQKVAPLPESVKEVADVRAAIEEAGGQTIVSSSRAEALHLQLPGVTITSPKDGDKVGKRITGRGVITGLGAGQRGFLCMKNRAGVTYPRGEVFPSSDGRWSLTIESSHHDFEIFVVIATGPAAGEALSDRSNQEHGMRAFPPQGATIVGPVVSLNRQGKVADLLKSDRN